MKNVKRRRTIVIGVLALVLLCGCTGSRRDNVVADAAAEVTMPEQLAVHVEGLERLQQLAGQQMSDSGTVFRIYYDDTRSMLGFVTAQNGNSLYVNLLDAAIDQAIEMRGAHKNGIESVEAYTLVAEKPVDGVSQELNWSKIDAIGTLKNYFMSESFYTGSHNNHRDGTLTHVDEAGKSTVIGPLTRLFMKDENPFAADGLTVVVSDLMEQGFDLYTISEKIAAYCEKVPSAEVRIAACTSNFSGQISVPIYSNSDEGTTMVSVDDYDGEATCYYIIAGPANLVEEYCAGVEEKVANSEEILWAEFRNQDRLLAEPLLFKLAPNTMAGVTAVELNESESDVSYEKQKNDWYPSSASGVKLQDISQAIVSRRDNVQVLVNEHIRDIWGSANINSLKSLEGLENVFQGKLGVGTESCSMFGTNILVSAYADLSEEMSVACSSDLTADYTYYIDPSEMQLYEKTESGKWTAADRNALGCVDVRFEAVEGPLKEYGIGTDLLTAGRRVAYLRVMVDTKMESDGGLFREQTDYYLTVPIHTTMLNTGQLNVEELEQRNANIAEYRMAIEALSGSGDHYNWAQSSEEARKMAQQQFCKTPKLDVLTKGLTNVFEGRDAVNDVQYVDFIFFAEENVSTGRT